MGVHVLPHVPCLYLHDQDMAKGSALQGKQEMGDNSQGLSQAAVQASYSRSVRLSRKRQELHTLPPCPRSCFCCKKGA